MNSNLDRERWCFKPPVSTAIRLEFIEWADKQNLGQLPPAVALMLAGLSDADMWERCDD